MNKRDIKILERMIADPDIKGKGSLRKVLWLNTVKPKYKVGDCYKVTDPGHRVYGVPIKDFRAKVERIEYRWDVSVQYGRVVYVMTAHVVNGDKEMDANIYMAEYSIGRKVKDNVNVIEGKDKYPESIDVYV